MAAEHDRHLDDADVVDEPAAMKSRPRSAATDAHVLVACCLPRDVQGLGRRGVEEVEGGAASISVGGRDRG
jgi:hypothetical protein